MLNSRKKVERGRCQNGLNLIDLVWNDPLTRTLADTGLSTPKCPTLLLGEGEGSAPTPAISDAGKSRAGVGLGHSGRQDDGGNYGKAFGHPATRRRRV